MSDAGTLGDVGEFSLIADFTSELSMGADVRRGPGDDAAVLAASGHVVCSTDALIEGVHFRRDWSSAEQIGRKSVAVNVADIEAMGVKPTAILVCFSAPAELPTSWVREWWSGVRAEADTAGVSVVGGDVTRASRISIAVTALGDTGSPADGTWVGRDGAVAGDVVALCGRTGWAAAGLAALMRGFRSPRSMVLAQQVPQVPYGQGCIARSVGAHAMVDVSDGLLADLGHIADASGTSINLDSACLPIPEAMEAVAAATGADPLHFRLTGGEDHALVACFPADVRLPDDWTPIGGVGQGSGVTVDGTLWDGAQGWDHFG